MLCRKFDLFLITPLQRQQGNTAEGRVFQLLPELQFLFVETCEIVTAGVLNRRMEGSKRLDHDFTLDIPAPGPARHLSQQLKGALAGAEIRHMQRQVGINNSDERDVWKMQTLGDHLGSDQDIGLAGSKITENAAIILLP